MLYRIKEIFKYREMIFMLVKRNLRSRYRRSMLGFAWTFINPLLQLMIYNFVFSTILKSNIDKYYLFLFVALIPWMAHSSSIIDGSMCIVTESNLVTKMYFPRQVLPIAATMTCYVNMLLCLIVVCVVCFINIGIDFSLLIYIIPIVFIEFIFSLSISLLVSSMTIYMRDLKHILEIVVLWWLYATPILYSIDIVPDDLKKIFYLNPMTAIISFYRDVLYYKVAPTRVLLLVSFFIGVIILFISNIVFEKLQKGFAEEL